MDLCWESQQRIRELAAQIDGRSDWERAKKIADLLNQDLQLYPPARRGRKWTQEGVTRYLKKLPHEPSSKKGASRIEPVWVKGSVPRGFWRNPILAVVFSGTIMTIRS
jgi:hypothetical protein